ncbi:MAG TPA: cupredoxin domain-containing protein, partial [Candidatus Dormibacteraeota bacterium]|nr:cupredoxin domain-containing protein [Candidatus Dormibacteraeota bacterium]
SSAPPTQPAPGASCAPSGTTVRETAQGIAFSQSCLAAPANKGFTIQFDNKDTGVPHNIHIFESDPAGNPSAASLFSGSLVTGPATTSYAVGALPAGTYYFHCDVHPIQMHGTFVVA